MERTKIRRKSKQADRQRRSHHNTEDPEYHVVDDQERAHNVHIQPAIPLNVDREYAERRLSRSSSEWSLSSNSSDTSDTLPRYPPRDTPFDQGPAVNRDLKPGRNQTLFGNNSQCSQPKTSASSSLGLDHEDERAFPVEPQEQHGRLSQRLQVSLTQELVNRFSEVQLRKPSRDDQWRQPRAADFRGFTKDQQSCGGEAVDNHTSRRHSLDLDAKCPLDKSSHHKSERQERSSTKHRNHEWPQTSEDVDHHTFVPKEKPQQTYLHQNWYIGPCNRADAEHALHLVNEDGAYLVRDCSKNNSSEPYVLAVYDEKKVYNIKIRYFERDSKYALGTGQRANDMFDSVADIIKYHTVFPIVLVNGKNGTGSRLAGNCVLTYPITKKDVGELLG